MKKKYRISAVSYTNTIPFIYGLENHPVLDQLEISTDYPSLVAEKLKTGKADIGLVPVAVIGQLENPRIISDYCIGAENEVGSVNLYSDVPLGEIKTIVLDYQSRTSVMLTRILSSDYWKIFPEFRRSEQGFENSAKGNTAVVVIGDRTFSMPEKKYVYDLAKEWKHFTGLPFVFAAWVSVQPFDPVFESDFNDALKSGLDSRDQIIENYPAEKREFYRQYLKELISYELTAEKRKGLALFLQKVKTFTSV